MRGAVCGFGQDVACAGEAEHVVGAVLDQRGARVAALAGSAVALLYVAQRTPVLGQMP